MSFRLYLLLPQLLLRITDGYGEEWGAKQGSARLALNFYFYFRFPIFHFKKNLQPTTFHLLTYGIHYNESRRFRKGKGKKGLKEAGREENTVVAFTMHYDVPSRRIGLLNGTTTRGGERFPFCSDVG